MAKGKQETAAKPARKPPGFLAKAYLLAYNGVQTAGWSYMLYKLVSFYLFKDASSATSLWDSVKWSVIIFQNAAVLEVAHAATGLVPSNAMVTLMQVYSRVFVVCGVLMVTKAAPAGLGLPLSLFAWCVTEIVRYSYYTFSSLGRVPDFLSFLRYTLFIALYPIGITGELLCMYHAQREVAATGMWSAPMPNRWNFAFNYQYFLVGYMLMYIPFFPMLYGHMFAQRKKVLGGGDKPKKN